MRIKQHPGTGLWVREDGAVLMPPCPNIHRFKHTWMFGSDDGRKGYLRVQINGKRYGVHRLVVETFIGPIPEGYEVDHLNRNPQDNRCENLRIVTPSQNNRNTRSNDRVDARGGTHKYEDAKQFYRERDARRNKTHKYVLFSDGKKRWLPNEQAAELLKLPVKERV